MKPLCIAAMYLVTTLSVARAADKSFTGEIMDSQCADMGTHDDMMKGEHASNAKDCAIACVKKAGRSPCMTRRPRRPIAWIIRKRRENSPAKSDGKRKIGCRRGNDSGREHPARILIARVFHRRHFVHVNHVSLLAFGAFRACRLPTGDRVVVRNDARSRV